jgi:hypothetical protein
MRWGAALVAAAAACVLGSHPDREWVARDAFCEGTVRGRSPGCRDPVVGSRKLPSAGGGADAVYPLFPYSQHRPPLVLRGGGQDTAGEEPAKLKAKKKVKVRLSRSNRHDRLVLVSPI